MRIKWYVTFLGSILIGNQKAAGWFFRPFYIPLTLNRPIIALTTTVATTTARPTSTTRPTTRPPVQISAGFISGQLGQTQQIVFPSNLQGYYPNVIGGVANPGFGAPIGGIAGYPAGTFGGIAGYPAGTVGGIAGYPAGTVGGISGYPGGTVGGIAGYPAGVIGAGNVGAISGNTVFPSQVRPSGNLGIVLGGLPIIGGLARPIGKKK